MHCEPLAVLCGAKPDALHDQNESRPFHLILTAAGVKTRHLKSASFKFLCVKNKSIFMPMQYFYHPPVLA